MAFGQKGLNTATHDQTGFGRADVSNVSHGGVDKAGFYEPGITDRAVNQHTPGPTMCDNEMRVKSTWQDGLMAIFSFGLGALLLNIAAADFYAQFEWYLMAGGGCLFTLGGVVILLNILTGKAKLVTTEQGLYTESVIGNRFIAWDDLEKMSALSINFNKLVQAKAKPKKSRLHASSGRINIPLCAMKRKDLAIVTAIIDNRPDLAETVFGIMHFVGAKKQAKALLGQME